MRDVARFPGNSDGFVLIGRRHLLSNNSWMHGSHRLTKGKARDQLFMHPGDLHELGLEDGQLVDVHGDGGSLRATVKATDDVMRGVVSLPHGYGHTSYNDLVDNRVDAVSGNAALNGVSVRISASSATPPPSRAASPPDR